MGYDYTDVVFKLSASLRLANEEQPESDIAIIYGKHEHAVLLFLAYKADNKTGICWPGTKAIMRHTHLSESVVHRAIASLRKAGLMMVKPPSPSRASNTYRLSFERLTISAEWCQQQLKGEPEDVDELPEQEACTS